MMNRRRIGMVWALAALVVTALGATPSRSAEIVIATGEEGSLYHQVGRSICHVLRRKAEGLTCLPLPTSAGDTTESVANLHNVRGGAVELGLAQADSQFYAVEHSGPFQFVDATFENLRSVFSLHSQEFTLLAHANSGIRKIDDLKGRRVNIGSPGSTQRRLVDQVMAAMGWSNDDFLLAEELPSAQQSLSFCHDRVEAIVYTVIHPDPTVKRVAELCDAVVVAVEDPKIDKLVSETAFYSRANVPGGLYARNDKPVATFGVTTTLVSSTDIESETIYAFVKAVFDNFETFKAAHPAFGDLEPDRMLREGLTAPLHEGALRYYREMGMM